jgi:O-antigen/teichoic acid export membrane protein
VHVNKFPVVPCNLVAGQNSSTRVLQARPMPVNGLRVRLAWMGKGGMALADQGLVATSGFLVNVLLARSLAPEQYGAYALAFSVLMFLAGLHNALLLEPMSVLGPASYGNCLPVYLGKLLRLHFALSFLLALLPGLGIIGLRHFTSSAMLPSALRGVSLAIPWILFFWLWRRAAYLDLRPGVAVRGSATYALVALLLVAVFYRLGWLSPLTAFLVQAVAGIVAATLLIVSIRPQLGLSSTPMGTVVKQHWGYGRWAVVTAFVYWLSGGAYYVIVGTLLQMEDVAAFRALQNFVLPVPQFITAMSLLVLPWASARFADQGARALQRSIRRITFLFTAAAMAYLIGLILFGRVLMEVVYNGRYTQFAHLLPLLVLPMLFMAASQGPAIAVQAMQAPSEVSLAYTAAGILTILAGVALTRYWGLVGAVLGTSASSLVFLVVITYRYQARLKRASLSA